VFAVDTNVLVYAHFELYSQHAKARAFCEQILSAPTDDWCIGWQVVYEYVRLTTHPSVHRVPLTVEQALADLQPYLACEWGHLLVHTPQHMPVLAAMASAMPTARGNFIHDLHYATLLREHGVEQIYTADSDFKKFDGLEVIDPTV
jgi:uncharacterized protein